MVRHSISDPTIRVRVLSPLFRMPQTLGCGWFLCSVMSDNIVVRIVDCDLGCMAEHERQY